MSLGERLRLAEASLDRHLSWIQSIDSKVSLVVAVNIGMLGYLAATLPEAKASPLVTVVLVVLGMAPNVISLACCAMAMCPRLRSPNLSVLFFGTISAHSPEEYTRRLKALTGEEYLADLLLQVHRNAAIASAKFGLVKQGTLWLVCGAIPWALVLFIVHAMQM